MKKLIFIALATTFAFNIQAQLDRSTPPPAGPAPKINIGEAQSFELKNGLKVFVVENHKNPIVSYSLTLDLDPIVEGEKAGYIEMAGELLGAGTSNRTKAQLDESIDFIGATFSTGSKGIYASSLKKHSGELLDIMTDVLYNPIFPAEELEKLQKQSLTALQSSKDEPQAIAGNIGNVLRYGKKHPYGEIMSESTIENITIDDCKAYYNTYFRPNAAYLVIVGDITLKDAKKQVKTFFTKWEKGEVPTHEYGAPTAYKTPQVVVSNKDGANQSTINLTYALDLKPGSADEIKVKVMNQILGGGSFSARLFQNLREDKAFTYGAYSRLNSDELIGNFNASAQVRTSVTDSAFTEIIYEMKRLRDEKVSNEDLQLVINSMAGSFSRSLEDPKTVARFALNIEMYHLPADYYETYLQKLSAVTVDDVEAMAKKYIKPENAILIAVGDVSKIKSTLKKFSTDATVAMYDFYGNIVESMPLPEGLTAENVVANYVKALGGSEAVELISDYTLEGKMNVQGMSLSMNIFSRKPNQQCVETYMQGNLLSKQVYNGEAGKVTSPMGEQKLEGEMLENMKYESQLFPELHFAELGYSLELLGAEEAEGQDAYKLKITNPTGKETTVYFSREDGLKIKEISQTPQGNISTVIKEYTSVNGVMFPKVINQSVGPQSFDITFDVIKVNEGVDASKFEI